MDKKYDKVMVVCCLFWGKMLHILVRSRGSILVRQIDDRLFILALLCAKVFG